MAAQLPRPGVEVIQEFQSAAPTIVTPALVPCVIGPYFEVIEVLNSDGTANEDAQLPVLYQQLDLYVEQSSFPSPRSNIDEVDVDEDSIRGFLNFGGQILEIEQDSAFHKSLTTEILAYVDSDEAVVATTFDLTGLQLIVQYDKHVGLHAPMQEADFLSANNATIEFESDSMTFSEVVAFINSKVSGLAELVEGPSGPTHAAIRLKSLKYGAGASIVVRKGGSANTALGFSTTFDQISVGRGFYAVDDVDGDSESPKIAIWPGTTQVDLDGASNTPDATTIPQFVDEYLKVGDDLYADGVAIGSITEVQNAYLVMSVEQNLMSHTVAFKPHRMWVQANNLTYPAPASSEAAVATSQPAVAATPAWLVGADPTFPVDAAESMTVSVTKDGVSQGSFTLVATGAWANVAAAVAGINAAAVGASAPLEAYESDKLGNEVGTGLGTHVGLRTEADNVGSGAAISFDSQSAGTNPMSNLGFTAGWSDIGENIRFLPGTYATLTTALAWASLPPIGGTFTNAITVTDGATVMAQEVITWAADHTRDPAGLAAAIADWNAKTLSTYAYESDANGVPTTSGGFFSVRTIGENFGSGAQIDFDQATSTDDTTFGALDLNVTGDAVTVNGATFRWAANMSSYEYSITLVADEDDGGVSLEQIVDRINDLYPGLAAVGTTSPPALVLTSPKVGEASQIRLFYEDPGATDPANVFLFPAVQTAGDDPGYTDYWGNGRPAPDMAVDSYGSVVVQSHLLRYGTTGYPYEVAGARIYLAYKGLRLDMSPDAENPGLIIWNDVDTLETVAPPISTDNPGSLMSYLALLNAPGVTVASIGVPEVSADAPDGTPLGYAKAAAFLETEEVYALAVASQLAVVHQAMLTHINYMSEPEQKGERILFFNPLIPTRANPTSVGSGTDANTTGNPNEIELDENIAPALIALGIDPEDDINPTSGAIENEVYLDLGGDDNYYLIQRVVNGTTVTVRTSFAAGDGNDDSFFSTTALGTVISDDWSALLRGDELTLTGSTLPDKDGIAETIAEAASDYGFRRGYYVHPDQCKINVTGLEQTVEGYYATAAIAGMVGQQPPQQPFTNFPITGLTGVVKSNEYFTETQLNVMAAGGVYILVQDAQGAPILCRHQLSTDTTSIEKRELSITKVVDYTAKFVRTGLRNFIGRHNITPQFIDQITTVTQGLVNFLIEGGVLIGAEVNRVAQDKDNPDTLLVDITLNVPYPCNYIRVTLII